MSKKSIDDILSDLEGEGPEEVGKGENSNEKTPVKFKKKKKKSWKKRIILTLLVVFLATGSVLGYKAYTLAKKVFQGEGTLPGLLGFLSQGELKGENEGRINVLLLGIGGAGHDGGDLTDTIMVASIKPQTNEVAMLSVPRDLYVDIDGRGKDKINAANAIGKQKNQNGGGPALTTQTVSKVLGIPIHYYVLVDFSGFSKMIDTVDGVDINVEKDLYDPFYPDGKYSVLKGTHHMDGKAALKYSRSRETTSDFDRAKRQQQVLVALRDKVLSNSTLLNPQKLSEVINILGDHVKTDMQLWEAQKFFQISQKVDKNKIINLVLDNGPDGLLESSNARGMYILLPKSGDYDEIQELAKNIFEEGGIKSEAAKVEILNGSGTWGQAKKTSEKMALLKIENISNASGISSGTTIVDYTGGAKPKTIKYLEDKLGVKATQQKQEGPSYDIVVTIGKDQISESSSDSLN